MDQVALYLQDAHPMREGIELVRYAESKGFDAVWQADSRLVRDAVVPMAAFAATTDRIKIGSGVIDIWTRNAARLASTWCSTNNLSIAHGWDRIWNWRLGSQFARKNLLRPARNATFEKVIKNIRNLTNRTFRKLNKLP